MSPETLSSLAAILLSLIFSYVPGLAPRYDALDPTYKRLIVHSRLPRRNQPLAGYRISPPSALEL